MKKLYEEVKTFIYKQRKLIAIVLLAVIAVSYYFYQPHKVKSEFELQKLQSEVGNYYEILNLKTEQVKAAKDVKTQNALIAEYNNLKEQLQPAIDEDNQKISEAQAGKGNLLKFIFFLFLYAVGIPLIAFGGNMVQHLCNKIKFSELAGQGNSAAVAIFATCLASMTVLYLGLVYLVFNSGV